MSSFPTVPPASIIIWLNGTEMTFSDGAPRGQTFDVGHGLFPSQKVCIRYYTIMYTTVRIHINLDTGSAKYKSIGSGSALMGYASTKLSV